MSEVYIGLIKPAELLQNLMYILCGEISLRYRRGVGTLLMYSIIIANIAPRIPGSLTHFHWPRLLRYKPKRVYNKSHLEGQ